MRNIPAPPATDMEKKKEQDRRQRLEKIFTPLGSMRRSAVPFMIHRRKYFKCWYKARFPLAMKDHDAGHIAAAVAVVGSAPYGHEILVEVVFVSLHDELMGPCDQREVVDMIELESARSKENNKEKKRNENKRRRRERKEKKIRDGEGKRTEKKIRDGEGKRKTKERTK